MASAGNADDENFRAQPSYHVAQLRRKPVPRSYEDVQSSPREGGENISNPLNATTSPRSFSGQYSLVSPAQAFTPLNYGPRPEPVSKDSSYSTISGDSSYSNDTQTSDALLLGTLDSANYPAFSSPSAPNGSYPIAPHSRFAWWNATWLVYIFFALGVVGAISHHAFYASLAGSESRDQLLMLRYGVTLAYLTKTLLVASVVLVFRQQIWATFQRKLLSMAAVDSLFAVMEDLSVIFNLEVFRQAKVAMFLVVVVWLAPLTVILAPATLTVESSTLTNLTTCSAVRTLNFTPETINDWRNPTRILELYELSLSFWNVTSTNVNDTFFFDYYTGPSQPVQQVATLSAYLQRTIVRENTSVDICGAGWNCSFSISFTGPGYKCSSRAKDGSNPTDASAMRAPFNSSKLIPEGDLGYFALTSLGDYAPIQVPSGDAGIPIDPPPYPAHLGAFRTEPVLWIGYSVLRDANKTLPSSTTDPSWSSALEPMIFSCEHYETQYTVLFNYTSGSQSTTVTNRNFISPVINTTFIPDKDAMDGTKDNTTATPVENYIYPQNVAKYRLTAAYHSLGALLRQFLDGTISFEKPGAPISKTEATKTRLINPHNYLAVPDLMDQVQSFYEDIILSLFSNPQFLVVAWAANSSQLSGTQSSPSSGGHPCIKSRTINIFVYRARDLWLVYGTMIILGGVAVALGADAISQNGGKLRNTRFSSIVAATRGRSLDQLAWSNVSASGDVPRDVSDMRLGYGLVGHRSGALDSVTETYYGFGVEGEVRQRYSTATNRGSVLSFERWNRGSVLSSGRWNNK